MRHCSSEKQAVVLKTSSKHSQHKGLLQSLTYHPCLEIRSARPGCIEQLNISTSASWDSGSEFSEFKSNFQTREIIPKPKHAVLLTAHACHYRHLLCLLCWRTRHKMISQPVTFLPTSSIIDWRLQFHRLIKPVRVLLLPPLSSEESLNTAMLAIPWATRCKNCASSAPYFTILMINTTRSCHSTYRNFGYAVPFLDNQVIEVTARDLPPERVLPNTTKQNCLKNDSAGKNSEEDCWAILAMPQHIQKIMCLKVYPEESDKWGYHYMDYSVWHVRCRPSSCCLRSALMPLCFPMKNPQTVADAYFKWVKITNTHCSSFCSLSGVTNKLPGPVISINRPAFLMNSRTLPKNSHI